MKAQIFNYRFWIKETSSDILEMFYRLLLESGFRVLQRMTHHFEPVGLTGLFLLAESHLAIHTFPEEQKSYIEISSCNERYYGVFRDLLFKSGLTIIEE